VESALGAIASRAGTYDPPVTHALRIRPSLAQACCSTRLGSQPGLPENPDQLLTSYTQQLDATYREVAGRLEIDADVTVDEDVDLRVTRIEAVQDAPS